MTRNPMPAQTARSLAEPQADRPRFPTDYGVPTDEAGLLPWSHARERLENAAVYWISTTRPNGRPHAAPVWGVWIDDTLYFDGSPQTRRGRNLAANPAVAVHLESGGEGKDVVIAEGEAREIRAPNPSLAVRLAAAYTAKYASEGYSPSPETWEGGGLYQMRPRVVIAWTNLGKDPTRWHFGDRSAG